MLHKKTQSKPMRFPIVLSKCSQKKLFIVLNGQKISLITGLLLTLKVSISSCLQILSNKISGIPKPRKSQKNSLKCTQKDQVHSKIVLKRQEKSSKVYSTTISCSCCTPIHQTKRMLMEDLSGLCQNDHQKILNLMRIIKCMQPS